MTIMLAEEVETYVKEFSSEYFKLQQKNYNLYNNNNQAEYYVNPNYINEFFDKVELESSSKLKSTDKFEYAIYIKSRRLKYYDIDINIKYKYTLYVQLVNTFIKTLKTYEPFYMAIEIDVAMNTTPFEWMYNLIRESNYKNIVIKFQFIRIFINY